jgi:hypothetical protein
VLANVGPFYAEVAFSSCSFLYFFQRSLAMSE